MPISVKSQIDFNKIETKNLVLENRLSTDTPIALPHTGQMYFETDTGKLKIYNVNTGDWEETSGVAIVDAVGLPTTDIKTNVIYRLAKEGYIYNNNFIMQDTVTCYSVDGTVITISTAGLTDNTDTNNPVDYSWENLTDAIITSFGTNITETNFSKDVNHFCKYNTDKYDIANKFESHINYELYHNTDGTTNGWILISSTDDATTYSSLSGKPTINNIEILGNQTSDYYGINREITETDYNALPTSQQLNDFTYFVDDGGTSSTNVEVTSFNNLTDKPSINGINLQTGMLSSDLDMYTRSEVDSKFSGLYKYKGVVANISSLPTASTSKTGDVYYVTAESASYAFNGSQWQSIGGTVDLTDYQLKQDNALTTTSKTIVGAANELNNNKVNKSDIVDNLTTSTATVPLSANQGKILQDTKENISNKVITLDSSSTDTQYPSAKAVFDNFAPITSVYSTNSLSTNVDNCVFNIRNTTGGKEIQQKTFFASITDPIAGGSIYGDCKTTIFYEGTDEAGIHSQTTIKQELDVLYAFSGHRKSFVRYGTLPGTYSRAIEDNKANITWLAWIPVEYPKTDLTLTSANTSLYGASTSISCVIAGGVLTIVIEKLDIAYIDQTKIISPTASSFQFRINQFNNLPLKTNNAIYSNLYKDPAETTNTTTENMLLGLTNESGTNYLRCYWCFPHKTNKWKTGRYAGFVTQTLGY